jgi:DHA3 family macrolide efflux protein-like MFS transporter
MYKNSIKYLSSSFIDKLGTNIFNYVISLYIFYKTQSVFYSGLILAIISTVPIVLNLVAGKFIEKRNEIKILYTINFIIGVITLVLILLINQENEIYIYILIALLFASVNVFSAIIYRVLVKKIFLEKDYIKKINSYETILKEMTSIISPLIAAIIYNLNIKTIIFINGTSFILASIIQTKITIKKTKFKETTKSNKKYKEVFNQNKSIKNQIILATIINLFLSGFFLYIPLITTKKFSNINLTFSFFIIYAIGTILGSIYLKSIKKSEPKNEILLLLIATSITISGFTQELFLISTFFLSVSIAMYNIIFFTKVQLETKEGDLSKMFAIIFFLVSLTVPIGNIIFGIIGNGIENFSLQFIGLLIFTLIIFYKQKNKLEW